MGLEARPAFACVQSGWRPAPPGPRHHGSRPRRGDAGLQGGSGGQGGCGPLALQGWAHRCPPCQALPGSLAGGVPLRPPAGTGARHSAEEVSWPPPESQLGCPWARSPRGAPGQGDTGVGPALCLDEGGTVRSGHYPQYARGGGDMGVTPQLAPRQEQPMLPLGTFLLLASPPQD